MAPSSGGVGVYVHNACQAEAKTTGDGRAFLVGLIATDLHLVDALESQCLVGQRSDSLCHDAATGLGGPEPVPDFKRSRAYPPHQGDATKDPVLVRPEEQID